MRLLIVCALMLVAPRVAEPCSCSTPTTRIWPADGSTDVPLNAMVVVRPAYGGFFVELRNATTNEVVTMTTDVSHPQWDFGKPVEPLQPNTTYVVTVGPDMVNAATATFTTGDTVDNTPSNFFGLSSLSAETMPVRGGGSAPCFSTCSSPIDDRLSRVWFDYESLPADVVYAALLLQRTGEPREELPLLYTGTHEIGFSFCSPVKSPPIEAGVEYCARLIAYDVAGNQAGYMSEVCSVAVTCSAGICDNQNQCIAESDEEAETGCGCSSTSSSGWLLFVVTALILSRRRIRMGDRTRTSSQHRRS